MKLKTENLTIYTNRNSTQAQNEEGLKLIHSLKEDMMKLWGEIHHYKQAIIGQKRPFHHGMNENLLIIVILKTNYYIFYTINFASF